MLVTPTFVGRIFSLTGFVAFAFFSVVSIFGGFLFGALALGFALALPLFVNISCGICSNGFVILLKDSLNSLLFSSINDVVFSRQLNVDSVSFNCVIS